MIDSARRRYDPGRHGKRVAWQIMTKVPKVTLAFWVIKICTTAMGEATSDYLVKVIDPVVAVAIGGIGLVAALGLQFAVRRYVAWIYWLAAVMVSVVGTMAADVLHVGLGIPYYVSTIVFAVALAIIFIWWYASERTLSIHSIYTRKRELFYWSAIMATFALGTASGDLTAFSFHLGYLGSAILFAVAFAIPGLVYFWLRAYGVLLFWTAYVLTRPLGASFADWFGKPAAYGGRGYGDGVVAIALTVVIVLLIGVISLHGGDAQAHGLRPQSDSE